MTKIESQARAKWRQADVTKACKGVLAAGLDPREVRVDPLSGLIIVFTGSTEGDAPKRPADGTRKT
jgi:hypothetical protein